MSKAKLAYAIWPWGLQKEEQLRQALADIKAVGFRFFESVATAVAMFKDRAADFKAIIDEYQVYPVSFYFWNRGDGEKDTRTVQEALDFLAANKIRSISVQAAGKPGGGATEQELAAELKALTRIGEVCRPYGIKPCLHPHANTMVMFENEIDFIMRNTDPQLLYFGPDTAHLTVGRCNAVEIFDRYVKRIRFVHLKDVKKNKAAAGDGGQKQGFEVYSNFLELGEGEVDLPGVLKVLERSGYDGYLTLELDSSRFGNKESAVMNMQFMQAHGFA
ncbi:MAG: TIM barrel protein [Lentisphaerae bacterium]|nr:TIM barrel protein [Lentisphaerota bacterium]